MSLTKTKGYLRLEVMRIHRFMAFYEAFDAYLEGRATAKRVSYRAKKMLEVGLPKSIKL